MKLKNTLLLITLVLTNISFAQTKKSITVKIQTSAECDDCKKRIESNLIYEKGIKFCKLDVPTKVLSVTYNPEKTSPEKIKQAVSQLGYDADDVKADSLHYSKLPECCKKGGEEHK